MRQIVIFLLLFFVNTIDSLATHIRAGEITATVIDCQSFRYRFTVLGYTDTGSDVRFGGGELDFGDGSPVRNFKFSDFKFQKQLSDDVAVSVFTVDHSFPGAGTYVISFREFNRNEGVVNIENSIQTPFYIETSIQIDPFLGCNETVQLSIPPIDKAGVGVKFVHNPGAFDPDGDSLSYELVINRMQRDLFGTNGQVNFGYVNGYKQPNDPFFGGTVEGTDDPATYEMDPITGDLVWNSPGLKGEYNVAFRVHEWRFFDQNQEWIHQGYVTRDMQILVEDTENNPPEIQAPLDTCVQANVLLNSVITATDPDGDPVTLEAYGEVFNTLIGNKAEVKLSGTPLTPQLDFSWLPTCEQVRLKPYEVRLKAIDNPVSVNGIKPISLSSFETWNVRVVAPSPELISAESTSNKSIKVKWNKYGETFNCGGRTSDLKVQVYRRVGGFDFMPDNCDLGIPEDSGYELIDEVTDSGEYIDADDNLIHGVNYCYRIVAVLTDQKGGMSYSSNEECVVFESDETEKTASIITHVDVVKTDDEKGQIMVKWLKPFGFDTLKYHPPFSYDVYRGEVNSSLEDMKKIANVTNERIIDSVLNTKYKQYKYYIKARDANDSIFENSRVSESLRLDLTLSPTTMDLTWKANTTWSNKVQKYPFHYIYRNNMDVLDPDRMILVDSVNVLQNGFKYKDTNGPFALRKKYCYYVQSQGSYDNSPAIPEPLLNRSQIICAQPDDGKPPCVPTKLSIDLADQEQCKAIVSSFPCESGNYFKNLNWESKQEVSCDQDIKEYEIYFSPFDDYKFDLLATVQEPNYLHDGLNSLAGCYYIQAIDRSGNRSEPSDTICMENCPYFELPNVFTPNLDGKNDSFRPFGIGSTTNDNDLSRCPRFVKSFDFTLYDQNGIVIYSLSRDESEFSGLGQELKDVHVNWTGENNKGIKMPAGVYYYFIEVTFHGLSREGEKNKYKGWVYLLK